MQQKVPDFGHGWSRIQLYRGFFWSTSAVSLCHCPSSWYVCCELLPPPRLFCPWLCSSLTARSQPGSVHHRRLLPLLLYPLLCSCILCSAPAYSPGWISPLLIFFFTSSALMSLVGSTVWCLELNYTCSSDRRRFFGHSPHTSWFCFHFDFYLEYHQL